MGCSEEISTILAMLQVQNILVRPGGGQAALKARVAHRKFEVEEGDLLTLLNIYTAFEKNKNTNWCRQNFLNSRALRRATEIRKQMRGFMKKLDIPMTSCNGEHQALLESYSRSHVIFKNAFIFKGDVETILKCITAGLFPNSAYLHYSGVYRTVRGNRDLYIHPNSCLFTLQQPQWCVVFISLSKYLNILYIIFGSFYAEIYIFNLIYLIIE